MLVRKLLLLALLLPLPAMAQMRWVEGRDYATLPTALTAETRAGKIEVAEVFSYGCIHCFHARNEMTRLQAALPADAYMTYVHASFMPAMAWPMFQRAWYTAQQLNIASATHERIFTSVWETGDIPLLDVASGRPRSPLPTIQQAAKVYARASKVSEADFLKTANSAQVNARMQQAEKLIAAWQVDGTPTLVVNGRYRIANSAIKSWDDLRNIVTFLVGLERQRLKLPALAP